MSVRLSCAASRRLFCPYAVAPSIPRVFSTTSRVGIKALPPRPKPPPDSEIEESYLKGSGPGGQKINKTNSAVQLKHLPTGIVVKSQATRSRSQNRKHAREILAQKVDDALNGDRSRSAIVGEVKRKKAASASKKSRRKYRKLQEGEEQDPEGLDEEDEAYLRQDHSQADSLKACANKEEGFCQIQNTDSEKDTVAGAEGTRSSRPNPTSPI